MLENFNLKLTELELWSVKFPLQDSNLSVHPLVEVKITTHEVEKDY